MTPDVIRAVQDAHDDEKAWVPKLNLLKRIEENAEYADIRG